MFRAWLWAVALVTSGMLIWSSWFVVEGVKVIAVEWTYPPVLELGVHDPPPGKV